MTPAMPTSTTASGSPVRCASRRSSHTPDQRADRDHDAEARDLERADAEQDG